MHIPPYRQPQQAHRRRRRSARAAQLLQHREAEARARPSTIASRATRPASCPPPGTVDVEVAGETLRGHRQPRRRRLGRRARRRLRALGRACAHRLHSRTRRRSSSRARSSTSVLTPFAVRADEIDIVQYGSDDTKTHRKIKHILGTKYRDRVGRLLVSELFTVGAGRLVGLSPAQARHRPPAARDPPRRDLQLPLPARTTASGLQLLQREDGQGRATPITSSTAPRSCSTRAITPACVAAGLRDVLLHHPRRPQPAAAGAVLPARACLPDRDHPRHQGHDRQVQMTVATLAEVLEPALRGGYAVAGLVVPGLGGCARLSWRRRKRKGRR